MHFVDIVQNRLFSWRKSQKSFTRENKAEIYFFEYTFQTFQSNDLKLFSNMSQNH